MEFVCKNCGVKFFREGNTAASLASSLRRRGYVYCSKSCSSYKHGGSKNKTSEYTSWLAMRNRCDNPNHESYSRYGGRGIRYTEDWDDFSRFLEDMGKKPTPKHELERIDNDKNYSKDNCVWATRKEQTRNRGGKRATRMYTYDGKTMCIKDWADYLNISPGSLRKRLDKGWPLEKALSSGKYDTPPVYTYNGRTLTLTEWSEVLGVPSKRLYWRINAGYTLDKVFSRDTFNRWSV
jgi:hypothetical protein